MEKQVGCADRRTLIDTLAYQFVETYEHRDKSSVYYDYICRDFFRYMADQDRTQAYGERPAAASALTAKAHSNRRPRAATISRRKRSSTRQLSQSAEWSAKQ